MQAQIRTLYLYQEKKRNVTHSRKYFSITRRLNNKALTKEKNTICNQINTALVINAEQEQ